ncbi:MAG TPA: MraY family glycosyltransferase [Tepidisphaeraceae bacterium]|jgi:UDP-GlcNAc:undecaprenyl-phosphate GlcNAc-1-phosphate transferase|nr:MraY family glycosyltransferase [Tepidisphaeraceae bacterium]
MLFPSILAQAATVKSLTWDDVLSPYIYVFYVAFTVSFFFTPVMRVVALYYGIIDQPDRVRKMHTVPIAYLGGVAVFLGWICGLAASQFLHLHVVNAGVAGPVVIKFSIVVGGCIILMLGLWDDIHGVSPKIKIFGQILAAAMLLLDGVGTFCTAPVLDPISRIMVQRLGLPGIPEWFIVTSSSLLVIAVIVGCCNASNLMDGLDGLCGGVTAIIAAGFLFLSVHVAMFGGGLSVNFDGLRVVLALALLGSVLGFVPYNFNPASIFMGDTGSMLLGYACAVMILLMGQGQHPKWFLASMVMFALPVLDTALAFARRYVNGRPLFSADRFHFHHQLVGRGFSVKQTVMIAYGLASFFCLLGVAIVFMKTRFVGAFWLVIFGSIVVAAYKMGMIHETPRVPVRRPIDDADNLVTPTPAQPQDVIEVPAPTQSAAITDPPKSHPNWNLAPTEPM